MATVAAPQAGQTASKPVADIAPHLPELIPAVVRAAPQPATPPATQSVGYAF